MFDKILVFINQPLDPTSQIKLKSLLETSGYQAFFTATEWQDVDHEGCLSRAQAVRDHLKQTIEASEAIFVDTASQDKASTTLTLPLITMPDSPDALLAALEAALN